MDANRHARKQGRGNYAPPVVYVPDFPPAHAAFLHFLYGLPGSLVDGRRVVIGYFQVAPYPHPQVSLVAEEGWPAVLGYVNAPVGGPLDGFVGAAFGSQLPGQLDQVPDLGVWHPARAFSLAAVALSADHHLLTQIPARRDAERVALLLDNPQGSLDVAACLLPFLLIGNIDQGLHHAPIDAIRDGVGEGMHYQAVAAQEGFVVAGVVQVAGEPGEVPQQ
jgi:hypothetical protein